MSAVEPARGHESPVWPLPDVERKRWTFGASRAGGKRKHAGVDLWAPRGSVILAPEAGIIIATQRFVRRDGHDALLFQTDTGPVILFGEIEIGSWTKLGHKIGSRVERGQPIAHVGINPGGDQMLHFEMYRQGTRRNHRWYAGQAPPDALLDPTQYLKTASALDASTSDDPGEDVGPVDTEDSGEHDHDSDADSQSSDDIEPSDDLIPKKDHNALADSPWIVIAVVGLALFLDWGDS